MLLILLFLGITAAEIGTTKYLSRVIDTGDGTSLKIESHGIPFHVANPEARRVNVKFGDAEHIGRESIAFRHGLAYIWVLNEGGAAMERKFDGKQVILQISHCDCETIRPQNVVSPSIIRQEVPLDNIHTFKIESSVKFEVYRRPDCVDMIIGKPDSANALYTNKIFKYGNYKLNVTNYSTHAVRFSIDDVNVKCSVGLPVSGGTYVQQSFPIIMAETTTTERPTTTTTMATTTTATLTRSPDIIPPNVPSTGSYNYEGMLKLDIHHYVKMQSSVEYSVRRPDRLNIQIIFGSGDDSTGSRSVSRVGEFTVEIINYSQENVHFFRDGNNILCQAGHPAPMSENSVPPVVHNLPTGVRSRSLELEGDLKFEVLGAGSWDLSSSGYKITVTVGNPVVNRTSTRVQSEFSLGPYTILIINYTSDYVVLEQINNNLRCLIAMDPQ